MIFHLCNTIEPYFRQVWTGSEQEKTKEIEWQNYISYQNKTAIYTDESNCRKRGKSSYAAVTQDEFSIAGLHNFLTWVKIDINFFLVRLIQYIKGEKKWLNATYRLTVTSDLHRH